MKKRIIKGILVVLIFVLIFGTIFGIVRLIENKQDEEVSENYENVNINYTEINGKKYELKDNIEVILCVGLDTYENEFTEDYTNNKFADFVTLLILDNENKTTLPIQINRDTMCDVNILGVGGKLAGKVYEQLAFAHTYGNGDMNSLINVKNSVSSLFHDVRVDYSLSLTMDAVPIINDEVGGVEVLIEDDFSNIDNSLVLGEKVTLLGEKALTYVRSRYGMENSSNIARMRRQRVYLRGLYEKCKGKQNDEKFVYNILSDLGDNLVSNTTLYDLSDLGNLLIEYDLQDAITLDGETKVGESFMEYYVDQKQIDKLCVKYLFNEVKGGN